MIYTVYHHAPFADRDTLLWDGPDFGKALKAALDIAGDAPLEPLVAHFTAACFKQDGKPVTAWALPDESDPELKALLFINAQEGASE